MRDDDNEKTKELVGAPKMPWWLKWGMVAFLAYMFLLPYLQDTPEGEENLGSHLKLTEPFSVEGGKVSVFGLEVMDRTALLASNKKILVEGRGEKAICGQDAVLQYEIRPSLADEEAEPLQTNETSFRIGSADVPRGLFKAVLEMKEGEKAELNVSAKDAGEFGIAREDIPAGKRLDVTLQLKELNPKSPDHPFGIRLFEQKRGIGSVLDCGEEAALTYQLWSLEGKKVGDVQEAMFTIGQGEAPLALEQAAIGMSPGGARMVLASPPYLKPFNNPDAEATLPASLPENQVVMIEVRYGKAESEAAGEKPEKTAQEKNAEDGAETATPVAEKKPAAEAAKVKQDEEKQNEANKEEIPAETGGETTKENQAPPAEPQIEPEAAPEETEQTEEKTTP